MNKVMNEGGGTGFAQRIAEPGMEMAGKTGTAQVRAYSQEEHQRGMQKNASLNWKLRDHGLFIGFAPVGNPKYAVVCVVEHGSDGHPQVVAARDVMRFCEQRDPASLPAAYPVTNSASAAPPAVLRKANLVPPKDGG
jgi:penicillin-binding protein 2